MPPNLKNILTKNGNLNLKIFNYIYFKIIINQFIHLKLHDMKLTKKLTSACPKDLLNLSFIVLYFGRLTVKGKNESGIIAFSEEGNVYTFPEEDVREYVKDPNKINQLIKH